LLVTKILLLQAFTAGIFVFSIHSLFSNVKKIWISGLLHYFKKRKSREAQRKWVLTRCITSKGNGPHAYWFCDERKRGI